LEKVSIVRTDSYNVDALYQSLKKAIELVDGFEIKDGMKVIIKPNLCELISSELGGTTDIRLVEALIKLLSERAHVKIFIVESDHWAASAEEEFKYLGFADLEKKYDCVSLVNISRDRNILVRTSSKRLKTLKVPLVLFDCDRFISVAKLKTHSNEKISGILKNQFGLLPERYKGRHHPYLSEVLTELNKVYAPDLCIVDGITAMEGDGPTEGKPRTCNIILVGKDPVAVDAASAWLMGFKPTSIPHLKHAARMGVGSLNFMLVGDQVKPEKFEFIPMLAYISNRFSLLFAGSNLKLLMKATSSISRLLTFMGTKEMPVRSKIARLLRYVKYGV